MHRHFFFDNRHSTGTEQYRYGENLGGAHLSCGYCHHTLICYKYHVTERTQTRLFEE